MKVAVLGWYGHYNMGDELILEGLKSLFSGWKVLPMSSMKTLNFPSVDIKEINKCDLFVLGGGELIHTNRIFINTPSFSGIRIPSVAHKIMNRIKLFNNVSWVNKIKIPKVILGCGVNANNHASLDQRVISELEHFDYIGLRDKESVNLLNKIPSLSDKVSLFYDLAFSSKYDIPLRTENSKKIAVVIPTDRFTKFDKGVLQNHIAAESKGWLQKKLTGFDKTIFLPFGREDNDDFVTCKSLANYTKNYEIVNPEQLTIQKVLDCITNCDMVFPYRLHGLILSFILGKKYEYYPYHRKLNKVYETIKELSPTEIKFRQKKAFKKMLHSIYDKMN